MIDAAFRNRRGTAPPCPGPCGFFIHLVRNDGSVAAPGDLCLSRCARWRGHAAWIGSKQTANPSALAWRTMRRTASSDRVGRSSAADLVVDVVGEHARPRRPSVHGDNGFLFPRRGATWIALEIPEAPDLGNEDAGMPNESSPGRSRPAVGSPKESRRCRWCGHYAPNSGTDQAHGGAVGRQLGYGVECAVRSLGAPGRHRRRIYTRGDDRRNPRGSRNLNRRTENSSVPTRF